MTKITKKNPNKIEQYEMKIRRLPQLANLQFIFPRERRKKNSCELHNSDAEHSSVKSEKKKIKHKWMKRKSLWEIVGLKYFF